MKKLGLVGGVCPESTVDYYLRICQGVRERVGRDFFPELTIESRSCFECMGMAEAGRLDELAEYFLGAIGILSGAGCEVGAICCNTGHIVFDRVAAASPIPLVSIVDATLEAAVAAGARRPLLLGTRATVEERFFKDELIRAGMAVITPPAEEREWLYRAIKEELERGIVSDESTERFAALVADGIEHGADSVILGCTELPMWSSRTEIGAPVFDTLQLHIDALIRAAMGE